MRGGFGPEWEIRMVRENLALAIACWTAVQKGQITPAQLPAGREALVSSAGQVVEVFNPLPPMSRVELARCSSNQVRCAFAFSAMQSHRTLEAVCPGAPLTQPGDVSHPLLPGRHDGMGRRSQRDDGLNAARACLYLLDRTFRRGMLVPVWACPPEYRQRFVVGPVSFVLDATELDGKPVSWDDFGGLEKYLKLLDFCAAAVEGRKRDPDFLPDFAEEAPSGHSNGAGTVEAGKQPTTAGRTPSKRAAGSVGNGLPNGGMGRRSQTDAKQGGSGADSAKEAEAGRWRDADEAEAGRQRDTDEIVRGFVDDRCIVGPGTRIIARGLYDEFLDWCMETEREPLSQRAFGMRLTGMGFRRKRRGRGRHWWEGLGLKDSGG